MDKLTACATCGTQLTPHAGPGRPATYCGDGCRRAAEFRIRGFVRRIDRAELELRTLLAQPDDDFEPFSCDARQHRMRTLKRWIRADTTALHRLLGVRSRR